MLTFWRCNTINKLNVLQIFKKGIFLMKKFLQALVVAGIYWSSFVAIAGTNVTLDKADPAPLNNSNLPFAYVYDQGKARIKAGRHSSGDGLELSGMAFYSKASKGTDRNGLQKSELGDLSGKWNLLALLDTTTPNGQTAPTSIGSASSSGSITTALVNALAYNTTGYTSGNGAYYPKGSTPTELTSATGLIGLQDSINEFFGFQTTHEKYCKKGARFQATGAIDCGLGMTVQLGVTSISNDATFHSPVTYNTTTPFFLKGGITTTAVNPFDVADVTNTNWIYILKTMDDKLIDKFASIADAIGLDITNFQKSGFEDLKGEIFWRKAIKLEGKNRALFTPFVSLNGSFDLGEPMNPDKILAMPFGNNGHKSLGGGAGFSLDFEDSFEIGAAMGISHYNCRQDIIRVPNSIYQNGIYPYKTAVNIQPGNTWYLSTFMNSYHFEEDISCFAQYIYVNHNRDSFGLVTPNKDFYPEVLGAKTPWSSHVLNLGLNYDVSNGLEIGCAAQIPLKQRNAHRSSTIAIAIAIGL
jgi:hypothetical protein